MAVWPKASRSDGRHAAYPRWEQRVVLGPSSRRRPGLERLASLASEFFSPVGAAVQLTDDGLTIDGVEYRVETDASSTLDAIALQKYGDQMQEAAQREILDHVQSSDSRFTPYGLELLQDGTPVALLKVSHATLRDRETTKIAGNFLIEGGLHWDELRTCLGGPSLVAVLDELPKSASAADQANANVASDLIRDQRSSGWDLNVLIRGGISDDRVVFSPISVRQEPEVRFEFTANTGEMVRGALRLTTPSRILNLALIGRPEDELLTRAWVFALRAFADLTCQVENTADPRASQPRRGHADSDVAGVPDREQLPATIPRTSSGETRGLPGMSDRLVPSQATARVLEHGHYVAGHTSRLPFPKQATPEARQRAAAFAIKLKHGETWTREHWRGIAGDKPVLEFVRREDDDKRVAARAK